MGESGKWNVRRSDTRQQSSMKVHDLIDALESFASPTLAEDWDNVGLILGSREDDLRGPVLLTIDLTERVAEEAIGLRCSAVVSYHPPLFHAVKRVTDGSGSSTSQRVALKLLRAGIAAYSPHTALDAASGGVTDWLADGLINPEAARNVKPGECLTAGADRRALMASKRVDVHQQLKIVTFVPEKAIEQVRGALASAGAGKIGNYEVCSFATPGKGTFKGNEESNPAVGERGHLEQVAELRLEMVCARRSLALALQTLRQFHPYEEPAIDVYPLEPQPDRRIGAGRRIMLDQPCSLRELAERLKRHLGIQAVKVAPAGGDLEQKVSRIGIVPGAGASLAGAAVADSCDVFVTGEMKYHEVNMAVDAGMSVMLGGHTPTERGFLSRLQAILAGKLRGVEVRVSTSDRNPIVLV